MAINFAKKQGETEESKYKLKQANASDKKVNLLYILLQNICENPLQR